MINSMQCLRTVHYFFPAQSQSHIMLNEMLFSFHCYKMNLQLSFDLDEVMLNIFGLWIYIVGKGLARPCKAQNNFNEQL